MPYLVNMRDVNGTHLSLRTKKVIIIGREHYCDIQCFDDAMSREHFSVTQNENGAFILKDNASANGTRLNNDLLDPTKGYNLSNGDVITAGKQSFLICDNTPILKIGTCAECAMPMRTYLEADEVRCPLCGGLVVLSEKRE